MLTRFRHAYKKTLEKPFARLVRHCINRVFAPSETAQADELDFGIGAILAVLAAPGAFVSVIVSDRYGSLFRFIRGQQIRFDPYSMSAPDEYFFIVLAMVVAAGVAVWKWDRLLPDRRDFMNLAPLPIRNHAIFAANMCAILALAALLSLDVNVVSCVLFPVFVTFQLTFATFLKFFVTHLVAVFLAGAFGFLSVFAVLGTLMLILPFRVFLRISFYVRCGLLFYLVALLSTGFNLPKLFTAHLNASTVWMRLPPPAWFLGLCESMRQRTTVLAPLARTACWAILLVLALSSLGFASGYRRCFLRGAEIVDSRAAEGLREHVTLHWLDSFWLKNSFERGSYHFVLRAMFRCQEQAFVLGSFVTIGIVLASQTLLRAGAIRELHSAVPSPEILSVPLIVGFFLVLGLYAAFNIPASLRSNWVFQLNADARKHRSASLARKVVFTFLVPLLLAPCFALYCWFWGWRTGALHTALVCIWCALLLEGLLVHFRKIPFTCSVPAFKDRAIVAALLFLLAYFVFTSGTATLENWAFAEPLWFIIFLPIPTGLSVLFYYQRKGLIDSDRRLIFEERTSPVVEAMNLTR